MRDLARLYIRFGFGAEAEALLAELRRGAELEDRALLVDLARAVEGRAGRARTGRSRSRSPAPASHGLWLALGGVAPAFHDAESFAARAGRLRRAAADLRVLLAPGLVDRLLDAGRPAEARLIYDTAVRPGEAADAGLELAGGAARRRRGAARRRRCRR